MQKLSILIIILIYPILTYAHPGKTDLYGGHRCLHDCRQWGLFHEEYHLHDKDWNPIRISKDKKGRKPVTTVAPETESTGTTVLAAQPRTEVVTTYRYITNVYEENLLTSNPLFWVLAVLLLLLLILRIKRKGEEGNGAPSGRH